MTVTHTRHIVLLGYRGAGKSTVGAALARTCKLPFIDTDAEIESRAGMSVAKIFARDGESAFRVLERDALADALQAPPRVISVGGGAPVDPSNRALLRAQACCVWLRAHPQTLAARIAANEAERPGERPALEGADPVGEVEAVLQVRLPAYRETAHHIIDADDRAVDELVAEIRRLPEVADLLTTRPRA